MTAPLDPIAAATFIVSRLYKELRFGDATYRAVSETERPFHGDTWFWTDDNAKVLEFLARPEIFARYRQEAGEIYRFLRFACRGQLICRRFSSPRLVLAGTQCSEQRYDHSVMQVRCDLPQGAVVAGIRFHDGRTADGLLMWANRVEFTYRNRRYSQPVERAIDRCDATLQGGRLELHYSGELSFTPRRQAIPVGRISYDYTIDARSMVIGVQATLDVDSRIDISDVVLSVGHDHLSHDRNHVHYNSIAAVTAAGAPVRFAAGEPGTQLLPIGGAHYYGFVQSRMTRLAGFALAVHTAPREPRDLAGIELEVREPGRLHLARAQYRFAGACRGRRLTAAEDKMLTAGGFYDEIALYHRLVADAIAAEPNADAVADLSASYDYGAELKAFAEYFAALARLGCAATEASAVKEQFDFYLQTYYHLFVVGHHRGENTIYLRQLAFVILSLVTMHRATGGAEYHARLVELCHVLLDFESRFDDIAGEPASGFVLGVQPGTRIVYVDCHSAALLALTEAAVHIADPRLAAAIDRGLGSYAIETARVDLGDRAVKSDLVAVHWCGEGGARESSNAFWNFHAGLTLRFFAALRRAGDPALRAVATRHRERLDLFEIVLRRQIGRSLTWHDGAVEIRTSPLAGETNSETQPWVALGLMADATPA